jgi:hypothetical protein
MTKTKKSWLARLEEADRKAQTRLEKQNNSDVKAIFQKSKRRTRKQTEQEKTHKLTMFVYGFFVIEVCILGGLFLTAQISQDYALSLGAMLHLYLWSAILSFLGIVIGVVALVKRPRVYYIHFPLLFNCLLGLYIVGLFF